MNIRIVPGPVRAMVLVLALALAGSGCQRTLLQQAPAAAGCDPALAGLWLSLDESGRVGEMRARVGEDCALQVDEEELDGRRSYPPARLATHRADARALLWVDAAWANATQDVETTALDGAGQAYVFEYALDGDTLSLWPPDHQRIAHAIVDDDIEGAVLKLDTELVNRIDGDADALRKVLGRPDFFDRDEPLRFRRAEAGE